MTIIIGAYLDDGSRVLKADGTGTKGVVVTERQAVKAMRIQNSVNRRVAAFGLAGTAAAKVVFEEVLTRMLSAPAATADDLALRLHGRFKELQLEHDIEAIVWFDGKLYTVDCALHVHEHVDTAFAFAGSGADHAQGALLGLGLKKVGTDGIQKWKPELTDVHIAYEVAVTACTNCGGKSTLIIV